MHSFFFSFLLDDSCMMNSCRLCTCIMFIIIIIIANKCHVPRTLTPFFFEQHYRPACIQLPNPQGLNLACTISLCKSATCLTWVHRSRLLPFGCAVHRARAGVCLTLYILTVTCISRLQHGAMELSKCFLREGKAKASSIKFSACDYLTKCSVVASVEENLKLLHRSVPTRGGRRGYYYCPQQVH